MTPAAEMLIDGWRTHWEMLGSPTFIYRGKHWPCTGGNSVLGLGLGLGPPTEQLSSTLVIPQDAFAIKAADQNEGWDASMDAPSADDDVMPPQVGKKIIFEARDYEVGTVNPSASGAFWIVSLVSPNS